MFKKFSNEISLMAVALVLMLSTFMPYVVVSASTPYESLAGIEICYSRFSGD